MTSREPCEKNLTQDAALGRCHPARNHMTCTRSMKKCVNRRMRDFVDYPHQAGSSRLLLALATALVYLTETHHCAFSLVA